MLIDETPEVSYFLLIGTCGHDDVQQHEAPTHIEISRNRILNANDINHKKSIIQFHKHSVIRTYTQNCLLSMLLLVKEVPNEILKSSLLSRCEEYGISYQTSSRILFVLQILMSY